MSEPESPRHALEAVIFAAGGPVNATQIRRALPQLAPSRIPDLVAEIDEDLEKSGRPYEIARVAGGYQFRSRPEFADVIRAAQPERKLRMSQPALETLALVAYRQPLTRAEIEDLRCVDCGAVLKGLLERDLVRIVGRRDAPGRPALYGTSTHFLSTFGLDTLRDLPELREIAALDEFSGTPLADALGEEPATREEEPVHEPEPAEDGAAL